MKVVALVSGGKDSCYNMVLCQKYGHEVVALANLLPQRQETDDLDSYMYQTVGHQLISAYARCMSLPLYRRAITGRSTDQRLVYEDTAGDEVEDLYCLLAWVKRQHPEVEAVASGAIASDYQRTRVERVCSRLRLVSLAYLWHQPQAALLQRMIDAGIDAVLVKVAAAGLTPERHLGARLASLPAQLHKLRRLYGSNVCGEGGEYESLTLDCPALFTAARIVLDGWQAVEVSRDSLAPVALLHPTAFHLKDKAPAAGAEAAAAAAAPAVVTVPEDWAPQVVSMPPAALAQAEAEAASGGVDVKAHVVDGSSYCSLSAAVTAAGGSAGPDPTSAAGTAAALTAALETISGMLPGLGLDWGASLFLHLYVPAMAQFAAANAAYSAFLPEVNPPSRATVQLSGGTGLALVVEALFARRPQGRRVLHVQSISEWAPSCIGPYSQATRHAGLVHFAGQIPLDPATMDVVGGGINAQCVRSLLSCQRVAVAVRTDLPRSMLWCTVYCCEAAGERGRQRAAAHLQQFLEGRMDLVALQGQAQDEAGSEGEEGSGQEEEGEEEGEDLDDYLRPPPMHRHWQPQVTFVVVPQLPRGVLVEIQPVACVVDETLGDSSSSSSSDDDDDAPSSPGRLRKGQAAADARPTGSTMPGWIGLVRQERRGSCASLLCSPGRLCRVQAWLPAQVADWPAAVRGAAAELAAGCAAAGLTLADAVACKAYCLAALLERGQLTAAVLHTCLDAALPHISPCIVPVSAVGTSDAADCGVLLEMLCCRVPA